MHVNQPLCRRSPSWADARNRQQPSAYGLLIVLSSIPRGATTKVGYDTYTNRDLLSSATLVALEFDGEDPQRPIMRSVREKARRDLPLLHEAFDSNDPLALPRPDEDAMALARKQFDTGYRPRSGLLQRYAARQISLPGYCGRR